MVNGRQAPFPFHDPGDHAGPPLQGRGISDVGAPLCGCPSPLSFGHRWAAGGDALFLFL